MKLFLYMNILMFYTFGMHAFITEESFLADAYGGIDVCSFKQVTTSQLQHSVYVEQFSIDPMQFHTSEPMRMTFRTNVTEKEAKEFVDTWVTIHVLQDVSICFVPNHKKTQEMKEKSEFLQQKLRVQ